MPTAVTRGVRASGAPVSRAKLTASAVRSTRSVASAGARSANVASRALALRMGATAGGTTNAARALFATTRLRQVPSAARRCFLLVHRVRVRTNARATAARIGSTESVSRPQPSFERDHESHFQRSPSNGGLGLAGVVFAGARQDIGADARRRRPSIRNPTAMAASALPPQPM